MDIEDNKKTTVNKSYSAEQFDDEMLLYCEETTQAVYLNDCAHAVWLLCQDDMTVGEIIDFLEKKYPNQQDQIREDVVDALTIFVENNVISLSDD